MTFLDVMNLWGSPKEMAADLGYKVSRVHKWRVRCTIPPESWPDVIKAAKRRRFNVTADTLLRASCARSASRTEHRLSA